MALGRVARVRSRSAERSAPDAYPLLRQILPRFPLPVHLVTGNHDDPVRLIEELGGTAHLGGAVDRAHYTVDYPDATVVVLAVSYDGALIGAS
jgi:3',5'-cyclic-AMP phosphodiesterase